MCYTVVKDLVMDFFSLLVVFTSEPKHCRAHTVAFLKSDAYPTQK